jgi:hypothetical protein
MPVSALPANSLPPPAPPAAQGPGAAGASPYLRYRVAEADSFAAQLVPASTGAGSIATPTAAAPPASYWHYRVAEADASPLPVASTGSAQASDGKGEATGLEKFLWGKDGFSVASLLHSLNPLQYIPVVSTIYQQLTGDSVGAVAHLIGGTLLGGPIGAVAAIADSLFEAGTGKNFGGHVVATLFGGDKEAGGTATAMAAAASASAAPAPPSPAASGDSPHDGGRERIAASLVVVPPGPPLPALPLPGDAQGGIGALMASGPAGLASVPPGGFPPSAAPAGAPGAAAPARATPPATAANGAAGAAPPSVPDWAKPHPATIPADFSQRMMDALDKYRAAARLHTINTEMPRPATDIGG